MKFPTLPEFTKKKIRKRSIKKAFVIAIYAFVTIMMVAGMVSPAFTSF